jgi:uncharacterized alkaline shock family protein YloU
MTDELVLREVEGTITIPAATLNRIVVAAVEAADGARVRRPRRGVAVEVNGASASVSLQLTVRFGTVLPELAETVQTNVARAVERLCGLEVRTVDIAVEELVER